MGNCFEGGLLIYQRFPNDFHFKTILLAISPVTWRVQCRQWQLLWDPDCNRCLMDRSWDFATFPQSASSYILSLPSMLLLEPWKCRYAPWGLEAQLFSLGFGCPETEVVWCKYHVTAVLCSTVHFPQYTEKPRVSAFPTFIVKRRFLD